MDQSVAGFLKHTKTLIFNTKRELFSGAGRVKSHAGFYLRNARENVVRLSGLLGKNSKTWLGIFSSEIFNLQSKVTRQVALLIQRQGKEIETLARQVSLLDPRNVLSRGFSITLHNGKAVRRHVEVQPGDPLQTLIFDGTIYSTVTGVEPEQKKKL
jgi:exodeoxyribonuclease VII large subunit